MAATNVRIKMRVGVHEFEAEGSAAFVQSERQRFEALVKSTSVPSENPLALQPQPSPGTPGKPVISSGGSDRERYSRLFKVDGQGVLSLIGQLPGKDRAKDAIVLLLFGYYAMLSKSTIPGIDLTRSMNHSGYPTERVDRMMGKYATDGTILTGGKQRRGRHYSLSNPGTTKARVIADEMVKLVK